MSHVARCAGAVARFFAPAVCRDCFVRAAIWREIALVHLLTPGIWYSDRGVQYLPVRYPERLAKAGAVTSVGGRGDSYENSMAEPVTG